LLLRDGGASQTIPSGQRQVPKRALLRREAHIGLVLFKGHEKCYQWVRHKFVRWEVEEELCYVASEARFEGEASK
jgi:hypothetical protein